MNIIKIIKNALIHLLGGITKEERNEWIKWKYYDGKKWAYFDMLDKMCSEYGKPGDDWCKIIYDFAKKGYDDNMRESSELFDELQKE